MKRIVNGVTYNTDTSVLAAETTWEDDDGVEHTERLYQTRGGAFFLLDTWTQKVWNEREREELERERAELEPASADRAHKWMLENNVEVFTNPFEDPPGADAASEGGATVYARVPAALKRAIDKAASEAKLSTNAWAMRCMQHCLGEDDEAKEEVTRAWELARSLGIVEAAEGYQFDKDGYRRALSEVADHLELAAKELWGTDDFAKLGGGFDYSNVDLCKRYGVRERD
jgi:predicted HicB family RNase H-like nuclease